MNIPRLVIAGTSSGAGKTTVTVGLARALQARGHVVRVFKCGPDYLDPTYHERATTAPCHNLDGWLMGRAAVTTTFVRACQGADVALIEGVMGLFDGASPTSEEGSTAEIAKWLNAPVILVCDAAGMARSIAALARGFATYDPELSLAGIVCNRLGSRGHLELLRKATAGAPPVLGGFPKDNGSSFPERHLGLHAASATTLPPALLETWERHCTEWCDLDGLLAVARSAAEVPDQHPAAPSTAPAPSNQAIGTPTPDVNAGLEIVASSSGIAVRSPRCRIGLARDPALHFYYDDNLRRLESLGAELVPFSPLADGALPIVDGLYLGGGYPELHAEQLSANVALRENIVKFAERAGPIYAECGGLMYLCNGIRTLDGKLHPMVGLVPGVAEMRPKLQALGYVEVETQQATLLGGAGLRFRGHQFRYSELQLDLGAASNHAYSVRRRRGAEVAAEGFARHATLASYVHAHWASNPQVAAGFVASCANYARRNR